VTEILSLDQIRALPDQVEEFCAGIYFLFIGEKLHRIGKAKCIDGRINRYISQNRFGRLQSKEYMPFDNYRALVLERDVSEVGDALAVRMNQVEHAYIDHYHPPGNGDDANKRRRL
jgi:hypothetical protein